MKDFKVNDIVVHCREGLAQIMQIITMGDKEYFLVKAKRGDNENIYVPFERADSIIRFVLNIEEADAVLKFMKGVDIEVNTNTKQRRDSYKRRLSSGDIYDYAYLSCQLYHYQKKKEESGIKLGMMDYDMLNYADLLIKDEFSLTYNIPRNEIDQFIENRIKNL